MSETKDIIVIGAGPAGMTACLYALRNGKSVILIEKNSIGGQMAQSPRIENFPTIASASGVEISDKMFDQIISHGTIFKFGAVNAILKEDDIFTVATEFDTFHAHAVIIAAGVEHRKLNLGEEKYIGHGLSYCALCDGAFYAGEDVTLIGDGNSALQYALLLSGYCKSVHVVTLFDKFFGEQNLVQALKSKENIKVTHNMKLVELCGNSELERLVFEDKAGARVEMPTKALFVAIGQVPDNKVYLPYVELDAQGYIKTDEKMQTLTPGLYAAGDCRVKQIRQVATACADGAIAASNACTFLA